MNVFRYVFVLSMRMCTYVCLVCASLYVYVIHTGVCVCVCVCVCVSQVGGSTGGREGWRREGVERECAKAHVRVRDDC